MSSLPRRLSRKLLIIKYNAPQKTITFGGKTMDFFKKTWVKILAWVLLIVGAVALILGGLPVEDIKSGILLAAGVVDAIAVLIAFVCSKVK